MHMGRARLVRHDVTERRGHLVEDRRAGHERDLGRGSALEHRIVVDEVVGAGVESIRPPETVRVPRIASTNSAGHPSV